MPRGPQPSPRPLRLDPAIPLVWRSPTSAQLGVAPVRAVLDPLSLEEERLLAALAAGTERGELDRLARRCRLPASAVAGLLGRVEPALERPTGPVGGVTVTGAHPLAGLLAHAIGPGPAERPRLAVIVAAWVVPPAEAGAWLRRETPHLPVVLGDGQTVLGPYVVPGAGPCLHCAELHRADADPAWPAIAAQLLDRPAPALDRVALTEAVALAARTVRRALGGELEPGARLRLDSATGEVSRDRVATHPECRCSAPQESDWERARPRDRASAAPS